jgi:hypothetical protein
VGGKAMNEEFLSKFRQEPRPEFNQSLYAKLTQDEKTGSFLSRHFTAKRMVLALVALSLVFALTLVVSPTVRAAVTDIIKTIIVKGVTVWVYDDVPAVKGESETYSEIWTPVGPDDISTNYPVFAKLPTWVPSGYLLQERAALFGSMAPDVRDSALFEWKNKHGDTLQLRVSKGSCPNGPLWESGAPRSDCGHMMYIEVGPKDQPEVIKINNQPALLFPHLQMLMELSDPIRKWNPYRVKYDNRDPEAFFLIWEFDGMRFEIAAKSRTISKEDLIHLAESIP